MIVRRVAGGALLFAFCAGGSASVAQSSVPAGDPLASLDFLIGSWSAKTGSAGSADAAVTGTYTFHRDLGDHALTRSSTQDSCKAATSFDCQHHDQLLIYPDPQNPHDRAGISALYLDSEGHVIHYSVSTPDAHTVVFQSMALPGTPSFRLRYHLEGNGAQATMTGSFEGAAPGSSEYHPYLQWSGTRQ